MPQGLAVVAVETLGKNYGWPGTLLASLCTQELP